MNKGKNRIVAFFGALLSPSVPSILPRGGYRVEVEGAAGEMRILVSGAERILLCNDREITLLSGGNSLLFLGDKLSCLTYEGRVAEISGKNIRFSVEENGKK